MVLKKGKNILNLSTTKPLKACLSRFWGQSIFYLSVLFHSSFLIDFSPTKVICHYGQYLQDALKHNQVYQIQRLGREAKFVSLDREHFFLESNKSCSQFSHNPHLNHYFHENRIKCLDPPTPWL